MDIAFLTDHLARGGAETQLTRVALALKRRGWAVGVVTMFRSEDFQAELEAAGIPLCQCCAAAPSTTRLPVGLAWRMFRQLRRWRPAVLVTFNYHGDIMGRVIGRLARVRAVVATLRTAKVKTPFRERLYRRTEGLIDLTASNSHAAVDLLVGRGTLSAAKTTVIPNAIDAGAWPLAVAPAVARQALDAPADAFVWLAVGNLRPAKDYPTLLAAARICADAVPAFRLYVAGGGDALAALRTEAERLGLAGRVSFLGPRGDVPLLLRASDALVLSSAWEGMPNTVMEAMASGLPVVCTDAGGVRELVRSGENGWIVPCRQPEALAERMLHLMSLDPAERRALGAAGRARIVREFDLERVVDHWEDLLRTLARQAPPGG